MIDYNNACFVSNSVSSQCHSMVPALDPNLLHDTLRRSCHNDSFQKQQLGAKKFYIEDIADDDNDSRSIECIAPLPGQHWSTEDSDEDDIEPILMTPTQQQDEWCCYTLERQSPDDIKDSNKGNSSDCCIILRRCKTRYYQGLSNLAANG
ncbi:hypothetical protein O0I10_002104 [Lichtheimia ornata]|uniref:Uncharacterized protein n=1 Tax=Lichtheimia ornata TaxID=688661 RepID=A0AAD7VBG2_9FUNG|nr:uncharacterized protein O0I10_002104 [Lichtheimia ornata]KAJ8662410.1 hypothetical protein O0I10_002104 [Lichtheimia ornata]